MIKFLRPCFLVLFVFISSNLQAVVIANFNANIVTGCSPILVQFNDLSTGNPTSWLWDLGNGTTSTLQNPSTIYINPGTYTVILTASDATSSNTKTVINYITVAPSPFVQFNCNDSSISCPPKTVQFNNVSVLGAPGTGTYYWDFGDGFSSTQQNPSHTYTNAGNFTVTLSVTNSAGCTKLLSKTQYVKLVAKPVAGFTTPGAASCNPPVTVPFTNTSAGGVSYAWNFGDGGTSTGINPSHTYTTSGGFNVTLIATNAIGCKDTFVQNSVATVGSIIASFTKSSAAVCLNSPFTFTNTSTPFLATCIWDFGDATFGAGNVVTHIYALPGTYIVLQTVINGNCIDTMSQTVVVHPKPQAQFSWSNVFGCTPPLTSSFTNQSTGATSYLWNFGDGGTSVAANPSHTYTSLGLYTVTLIATSAFGCKDTMVVNTLVIVGVPPGTFYANPPSGCAPLNVQFTTNVSAAVSSFTWNFGDATTGTGASTSHLYPNPGTYNVTMTYLTTLGCSGTVTYPIIVTTKPIASFTASPLITCPNDSISFTNTSTAPPGTTYTWYFGDGNYSTETNPSYAYGGPGLFTVTLVATSNGCSDTLVMHDYISIHLPLADFNFTYSCTQKLKVTFANTSIGANTNNWNFGDGGTSTAINPVRNYASFGTYTVKLTVTNTATGCVDSQSKIITLFDINPQFTADDTAICKGDSVVFTAQSNVNITSYSWNFGDGFSTTTFLDTVHHQYNTGGLFTVRLITTDVHGCLDTLIRTNYISVSALTVDFTASPLSGCAALTVNFADQTIAGSAPIVSRFWDFGDASFGYGNVPNPTHIYTSPGVYGVLLLLTDANGCDHSLYKPLYITVLQPNANFITNDTNICKGTTANFTNLSTGSSLSYNWNFGDGGTSVLLSPSHTYNTTGYFNVRLIVTDGITGCKDTAVKTIHVDSLTLGFTMSDTLANCPPLTVNFFNGSTGVTTYTWTFGNGNSSSLMNPSTFYSLPGVYVVKLKGTNVQGCKDSVTHTITVLGPTGTFSYAPLGGCKPLTVQFTSNTTNAQQLTWDMNNGFTQTTTATSFIYTFTQTGKFVPKLILTDGVACNVPIIGLDTIRVDDLVMNFSFSPDSLCQSGIVHFFDTTIFSNIPVTTRSWNFGDGGTSTAHNPSHFYAAPGTYNVTLIMGTPSCFDTLVKQVQVLPATAILVTNNSSICLGGSANLQATGATNYIWSPASGLSCTNCPNPVATPTVTTTYTVIGLANNGCNDTGQVTVTVHPLPNVSAGNDDTICQGQFAPLLATGAQSYSWTPTAGLSCINCANPNASPATTTTYIVTGTDVNGCTDKDTVIVVVNPLPNVTTGPDQSICKLNSIPLQANGAINYSWSPASGLSCVNCANPVASPTTTTTYTVTGTDANGCSNNDQVTITIYPQPQINAGPDQTICEKDSVQLQASGGVSYIWSPPISISCTACPNPFVYPSSSTTYTVVGTDVNGCHDSDQVTISIINLLPFTVGPGDTICSGDSTQLFVSGGSAYTWIPSTGLDNSSGATPWASPAQTTTYTVIITQSICISDTATVTVIVNPTPTVDAGPDQTIVAGTVVMLLTTATNTTHFAWTPVETLSCSDCSNPYATPLRTTTYVVDVWNEFGCRAKDDVTITVKCDQTQVFLPNTFTPNGDGANDRFYPQGKGIIVKRFRVYNRWGELVFDAQNIPPNDPNYGWDGFYKSQPMKPDVFVYIIDALCTAGDAIQVKGDVSLIR